ncbi:putative quinol monooxygenase [Nitratireductor sp. XY-223]|uniref:putative quinol monooxygenase n=1 Tax=Nitratireductor sp. XY-223 TaxID=2561926 RepID=UPI0010AA377A|nr:putative quinol monooxygenase [Nitratireductor sp. XY-223]
MFAVTVTFRIKPEHWQPFLSAVQTNAEASRDGEEGCRRFDVCTDADRPGEVFLYELYDDEAAFEIHHGTEHYAVFSEAVADLVEDKAVVTYRSVT